jgi:hypothetical protein
VPLDIRVRLPAGKFSYLLQDWDQALAVESPYQRVTGVLQRLLGLEQSVASLEQIAGGHALDGPRGSSLASATLCGA